jgi:hypothetical protein
MKSSHARTTYFDRTLAIARGSYSHRQEPTTLSGPHAPEPPTHQKS